MLKEVKPNCANSTGLGRFAGGLPATSRSSSFLARFAVINALLVDKGLLVVAGAVMGVVGVTGVELVAGAGWRRGAGQHLARARAARAASAAFFVASASSWRTFFVCRIRNYIAQSRRSAR